MTEPNVDLINYVIDMLCMKIDTKEKEENETNFRALRYIFLSL